VSGWGGWGDRSHRRTFGLELAHASFGLLAACAGRGLGQVRAIVTQGWLARFELALELAEVEEQLRPV